MKKNISSLIVIIPFLLLIYVPTILYLTIGENTENTLDEKRISENFPHEFKNDFFVSLENWYKDHTPNRMTIITKQKEISQFYGVEYRNIIHPKLSIVFTPAWYDESYRKLVGLDNIPFLAPIEDLKVIYGKDDWLFYTGDVEYYKGVNILSDEEIQIRENLFLQLYNICKGKGIQLVYMIGPNKEEVYPEYMPSYYIQNQPKREELFAKNMIEKGIPFIYPLDELINYKDQYVVYYQQDTHWNDVGGYIAAMQVYKQLGLPVTPIEDIDIKIKNRTGGDLSNFCGYSTTYTDYSVIYKPEISYSVDKFFDGNVEIFTSDSDNDRNIIIISDSFRNACKNIFARDFKESCILHQSRMKENIVVQFLQNLKEGDVILILSVERYDDNLLNLTRNLLEVL